MSEFIESLREEIAAGNSEVRFDYADMLLDSTVALQIKTLRQQREWTQEQLAELAEMKQSRISAMEQVDYSSWSIRTLKRLARAFDLRLRVTFEEFGSLLDDYRRLGRRDLERLSFEDDPAFRPNAVPMLDDGHQALEPEEKMPAGNLAKVLDLAPRLAPRTAPRSDNQDSAYG